MAFASLTSPGRFSTGAPRASPDATEPASDIDALVASLRRKDAAPQGGGSGRSTSPSGGSPPATPARAGFASPSVAAAAAAQLSDDAVPLPAHLTRFAPVLLPLLLVAHPALPAERVCEGLVEALARVCGSAAAALIEVVSEAAAGAGGPPVVSSYGVARVIATPLPLSSPSSNLAPLLNRRSPLVGVVGDAVSRAETVVALLAPPRAAARVAAAAAIAQPAPHPISAAVNAAALLAVPVFAAVPASAASDAAAAATAPLVRRLVAVLLLCDKTVDTSGLCGGGDTGGAPETPYALGPDGLPRYAFSDADVEAATLVARRLGDVVSQVLRQALAATAAAGSAAAAAAPLDTPADVLSELLGSVEQGDKQPGAAAAAAVAVAAREGAGAGGGGVQLRLPPLAQQVSDASIVRGLPGMGDHAAAAATAAGASSRKGATAAAAAPAPSAAPAAGLRIIAPLHATTGGLRWRPHSVAAQLPGGAGGVALYVRIAAVPLGGGRPLAPLSASRVARAGTGAGAGLLGNVPPSLGALPSALPWLLAGRGGYEGGGGAGYCVAHWGGVGGQPHSWIGAGGSAGSAPPLRAADLPRGAALLLTVQPVLDDEDEEEGGGGPPIGWASLPLLPPSRTLTLGRVTVPLFSSPAAAAAASCDEGAGGGGGVCGALELDVGVSGLAEGGEDGATLPVLLDCDIARGAGWWRSLLDPSVAGGSAALTGASVASSSAVPRGAQAAGAAAASSDDTLLRADAAADDALPLGGGTASSARPWSLPPASHPLLAALSRADALLLRQVMGGKGL